MKNLTYTLGGESTTVQLTDDEIEILQAIAAKGDEMVITKIAPLTAKQERLARKAAHREAARTAAPIVLTAEDYAKVSYSS